MDSKNLDEQITCLNEENKVKVTEKESWRSRLTLEPMWIGVAMSFSMGMIAYKNLFILRACMVDLGYSLENCTLTDGPIKHIVEKESQMIVTNFKIWAGFLGGFITCNLLVFLGPWSDVSGRRKPLIIMPITGMILTSSTLLILQAFPNVSTVWNIFADILPSSIGGHFSLLMMSSFNYLGDICYKTGKCPTVMMGRNSGFISLFAFCGSMLGPIIYRTIGFVGIFGISLVLELTALLYVIFYVNDVNVSKKNNKILDLKLPLAAIKCVLKKREGIRRRIILLMIVVPCCNTMMLYADVSISYMYVRQRFLWTEAEYSYLMAVKSIIHVAGTFFIVSIFKKRFKLSDTKIGLLGGISQIISSTVFMFSFKPWMVFGSQLTSIFVRGAMIADRPILNKQIQSNEQGKINCFTAVLEKCVSFIIVPIANIIYLNTMDTYPTTFVLIGILAGIIQTTCYLFVGNDEQDKEMVEKKNETP